MSSFTFTTILVNMRGNDSSSNAITLTYVVFRNDEKTSKCPESEMRLDNTRKFIYIFVMNCSAYTWQVLRYEIFAKLFRKYSLIRVHFLSLSCSVSLLSERIAWIVSHHVIVFIMFSGERTHPIAFIAVKYYYYYWSYNNCKPLQQWEWKGKKRNQNHTQ